MSQETSENKQQNTEGVVDSGSTNRRPAGTVSTTIRPRSGGPNNGRKPEGGRKRSFGLEIAMALILGALVMGIVVVWLATSSGKSGNDVAQKQPTPTVALLDELTPKNAATAQALVTKIASIDFGTAQPLSPTPAGTPLASLPDPAGASWPLNGGNPARTRVSPAKLTFPLKKLWAAQIGGELQSSPAIANGLAYFGSSNGNFYAVDLQSGQIKWQRQFGPIASSPAVAGNKVFFGTTSGYIYAVSALNGDQLWSFPTVEQVISSPVVVDGVVYIGSNVGVLQAIDANTGQNRYSVTLGRVQVGIAENGINTSPAISDGLLFFGGNNNVFYAIDMKAQPQPTTKWLVKPDNGGGILSSPAVADGVVYFGTQAGKFYAYKADSSDSNGTKLWEVDLHGPVRSSPAVANGVVYIGSSDKKVYALDAKTGEKKWEFATGDAVVSSPAVTGDTVLVGSNDAHLYALDAKTGEKKWDYQTDDAIGASPAIANGKVYITSYDGRLYAFGN